MGKFKIVSQKRWIKGLNAGTGILTQPPSTITRVSNLGFTQRGSLQTLNGSAIIGVLNVPDLIARALGVFTNLLPGQFPYYPTLTAPLTFSLPDITNFLAVPSGSASNAAGTYLFAVCATNGSQHSDPANAEYLLVTASTFSSIVFTWTAAINATAYQVYYIPGGPGASQGVLLSSPATNTYTFTGTLSTTPLVSLPFGNNSYQLELQIGNLAQPSKQVNFTSTAIVIPSFPPQPAILSPGDPNFQFQTSIGSSGTVVGTGTATATASQSGRGTTTVNGSPTTAFPSIVLGGASVSFSTTIDGTLSGVNSWEVSVAFQFSPDGGSTWTTYFTWVSGSGSLVPLPNPTIATGTAPGVTNLSDLLFRVQASAIILSAVPGNSVTVTGNILDFSVYYSSVSTFTPYGGVEGFVDWIPQILQFAKLSIFILGNGYAPQTTNPAQLAAATFTALANTFQATYPSWQATVGWLQGDNIAVLISGTNYIFNAIQGGTSAGTSPVFLATLGSTVSDGQAIWKNTGPLTTSVAPRGAAHGIVYAGSLWLYNTAPETTADQLDGPTCLKMSDSNNPNSWNPVNTAFLGKDDGTQGTGLATFTIAEVGIAPTQSLVCFKEFATFQVLGVFGATDFTITQAQTDLGCIAARSIQFLSGYGIARLTHMGFAIFDGVKDKLISEEIRPYLYGGVGLNADIIGIDFTYVYLSQSSQTSTPPQYICACSLAAAAGVLTRLFIYDLVLKAWTIMDLPWPITVLTQARTGEGNPLTIGFRSDGTGILERFFAGDQSWDAASLVSALPASATPIQWNFTSVYVYDEGSSSRVFYREVVIRGYSSQTTAILVTVTITVDGNPFCPKATYLEPQPISGQFELSVDLMFTAQIVTFNVAGTGVVTIDGCDWKVSPKPGGRIMVG